MSTGDRQPDHVTETNPEWAELGGEWLNPGHPGVNEWIVENLLEIVTKYDEKTSQCFVHVKNAFIRK